MRFSQPKQYRPNPKRKLAYLAKKLAENYLAKQQKGKA